MATTAIWAIKGSLKKLDTYVKNREKTEGTSKNAIDDLVHYAMQDEKVLSNHKVKSSSKETKSYVTAINCNEETSVKEMLDTKRAAGKEKGILAFHGYQSFAENEVTPDMAHEIGVKLANELWGERFQVVVATHLDKKHHIHNHFVLNSVSCTDGKKFNATKASYRLMRDTSDRLCREYNLSVIENPKYGKSKHYSEWQAVSEGRPTWRSLIKEDVDKAIKESVTDRQFFYNLKKMGYEINTGKDISVKPQGKERFMRLRRNFGDEYSIESINKRILAQVDLKYNTGSKKNIDSKNIFHAKHKRTIGGLNGLYLHYLFKLGVLPKRKQLTNAKLSFIFKEELMKLDSITAEAKFLLNNDIQTIGDLEKRQALLISRKSLLTKEKRQLNNSLRYETDDSKSKSMKSKRSALSKDLYQIRKELNYCENISKRSVSMKSKLVEGKEETKEKEEKENVQLR